MNKSLLSDKWTFSTGQSGDPERVSSLWDLCISTSVLAKSDSHIMIRDTLKTLKKRFWLGKHTRTQEKRGKKGSRAIFASVNKNPCNCFCYVTHVTADCVYNQYTYREAAKIKQKNQWRCRWTRVQCPNGFGPRHASRLGPGCYFVCDLFVSVLVQLRAHSALTSAIRRIRRRHRPRTYGCQSIWLYSLCRPESRIHWTAKNSTDQNSFYWPKSTDQEAACVEQ